MELINLINYSSFSTLDVDDEWLIYVWCSAPYVLPYEFEYIDLFNFWETQVLNRRDTYFIHSLVLIYRRRDLKYLCSFGRGLLDLAEENQNTSATLTEVNFRLCYTLLTYRGRNQGVSSMCRDNSGLCYTLGLPPGALYWKVVNYSTFYTLFEYKYVFKTQRFTNAGSYSYHYAYCDCY